MSTKSGVYSIYTGTYIQTETILNLSMWRSRAIVNIHPV